MKKSNHIRIEAFLELFQSVSCRFSLYLAVTVGGVIFGAILASAMFGGITDIIYWIPAMMMLSLGGFTTAFLGLLLGTYFFVFLRFSVPLWSLFIVFVAACYWGYEVAKPFTK